MDGPLISLALPTSRRHSGACHPSSASESLEGNRGEPTAEAHGRSSLNATRRDPEPNLGTTCADAGVFESLYEKIADEAAGLIRLPPAPNGVARARDGSPVFGRGMVWMGALLDAVNETIMAATHLTPMDDAAVAALRAVAQKIDVQDEYFRELEQLSVERHRPPPSMDNVSLPTFLKFCESLGLTPAGRIRAQIEAKKDGPAGTLGKLRLAHGRQSTA